MSIKTEIERIIPAATRIKTKVDSLELDTSLNQTSNKIEDYATAIESLEKIPSPSVELKNSEQTIECSGKIVDGDITIPAANIYYTGSNVPDSSFGNNGDIYLII